VTIVAIILTSMIQYVVSQMNFSANRIGKEQAFQIAEAGVYYYRWALAHKTVGMTAAQLKNFWGNEVPGGTRNYDAVEYVDPETNVGIGQYQIEVTKDSPETTIATAKVTGWTYRYPNTKRVLQVRFRRPSWSEYLFLSHSFINFGAQSEVWGKVFSNTGVRFDGIAHNTVGALPPSFDDKTYGGNRQEFGVHTTDAPADEEAPSYPWPDNTVPNRPDVFMGGRAFPMPEVSFNGVSADLEYMKEEANSGGGRYFNNNGLGRKILLKTNGTFDVCTVSMANSNTHAISRFAKNSGSGTCNSCSGECLSNYPIPDDGIIFVENNAWVDGSVSNKRVTIVAANLTGTGASADIYIGTESSNLRYASYNCENMIGLVAQNDVRVLGTCNDNYIVDAAILAQAGTIGINDNGFSGKNTLTFNGAIASYLQPYFTHGNSGFAVRFYNFDNDLLYCPPPYFPTGTEYSIDRWEEL
jgi:hypothetical protein